jgi:hypothetical protein
MKTRSSNAKTKKKGKPYFPKGWNLERVQERIDYYDSQSDEEGAAEYEAAMEIKGESMMIVPTELVPEIEKLIARRRKTA